MVHKWEPISASEWCGLKRWRTHLLHSLRGPLTPCFACVWNVQVQSRARVWDFSEESHKSRAADLRRLSHDPRDDPYRCDWQGMPTLLDAALAGQLHHFYQCVSLSLDCLTVHRARKAITTACFWIFPSWFNGFLGCRTYVHPHATKHPSVEPPQTIVKSDKSLPSSVSVPLSHNLVFCTPPGREGRLWEMESGKLLGWWSW